MTRCHSGGGSEGAQRKPRGRSRAAAVGSFADEAAAHVERGAPIPVELVEEGLRLLGEAERRRIIASWASLHPHRWRSLSEAVGDIAIIERAMAASAVLAAIVDRITPAHELAAVLENGELSRSLCAALAIVLLPGAVWSYEDALTVQGAAAGLRSVEWMSAIEESGEELVRPEHVERLRRQSARLAAVLPYAGLPRASQTLSEACSLVVGDDALARATAVAVLVTYAGYVHLSS